MRKESHISTVRGHSFYPRLLSQKSIIVDLGAHKGEFSSEINRMFECQCHTVEALPALFSFIADKTLITKYNFAMAGRDEPIQLFISSNPEANTITGSPTASDKCSITIDGITLKSFMSRTRIKSIDLLKIDIEGAEVDLFDSASDDTLSSITQITVEFHDFVPGMVSTDQVEKIKKRLKKLGFYVIKFSSSKNQDVLFINRKLSGMSKTEYLYIKYFVKYYLGILRVFKRWINT